MRWLPILLLISTSVGASLPPVDSDLQVRAQARACYLGFIKLYDVDYLAGETGARCVRVSYLRGFSADQLGEATTQIFRERHGETVAERYRDLLGEVNRAYADVDDGDSYTYCVTQDRGGVLLRDARPVSRIASDDFARRFMQIWVTTERADGGPDWAFRDC